MDALQGACVGYELGEVASAAVTLLLAALSEMGATKEQIKTLIVNILDEQFENVNKITGGK